MPKISTVSWSTEYAGHGGDIETKESTANGGEATDGVDVVERLHPAKWRSGLYGEGSGCNAVAQLGLSEVLYREGSLLVRVTLPGSFCM